MYLWVMSDKIFLLSEQNGALIGHVSFQGKKNNHLQPWLYLTVLDLATWKLVEEKLPTIYQVCFKKEWEPSQLGESPLPGSQNLFISTRGNKTKSKKILS